MNEYKIYKLGYVKCLIDLMKDNKDKLINEKTKLLYIIMFNNSDKNKLLQLAENLNGV